MRTLQTLLVIASLLATTLPAYAINVSVKATNKEIQGLGFSVKGKQYGGMGTTYKKTGVSKGNYTFGLRKNGKDIGCRDSSGKKKVLITKTARVVLDLKGNSCSFKVSQR